MDTLKEKIEIDVKVSPETVAELFCSMDDTEQAIFFNHVHKVAQTWPVCNFDMQMCSVGKSLVLEHGGRDVMATIGMMSDID